MPISILMPALSPTMETGNLAKWHVKEGDKVVSGDVIAEIETDKATMEVESIDEGVIGKILVAEGAADVPVNQLIALLLEDGEDAGDLEGASASSAPPPAATPAPSAPTTAAAAPVVAEAPVAVAPVQADSGGRVFASPLARRIAQQNNVSLSQVTGTGPKGRIVKRDVETAMAQGVSTAPAAVPAQATQAGAPVTAAAAPAVDYRAFYDDDSYEEVALDSMRKTIAKRLTASKRDIPHFYLTLECRVDELLDLRKKLNARSDEYKISVNDFVIRASALALKAVPEANATWAETHILRHKHADISMAVAIDGGLITPIIRAAETKGLATIANEAKDLALRARDRKLSMDEFEGGTFSVSNLGMFGIKNFTAVINPPQAAILAVGAGEKRAVVTSDGSVEAATMMTVTLSCDHRVIDGALGARLLGAFKGFIEEPLTMML